MGIFSRLTDIVNSNINALLDRAENPEKMLKNIIVEMEDTLVEIRTNAAKFIADKKQLQRQLKTVVEKQQDWQQKAELALTKGREDLAKEALIEKANMTELVNDVNEQLVYVDEDIAKYNDDIGHLQTKLNEARKRQQQLTSRITAGEQQLKVRERLSNERFDKIIANLDQFENKMDFMEAKIESHQLGVKKSLADEINELEVQDSILDELNELKKKVKLNKKES